jgi:hypothetical protein
MNDLSSSPAIKALLEAARRDGPGAAVRTKIWGGISGTIGGATASGGAAAGLAKIVTAGTLFGGAITVGVAAALLYVGAARGPDAAQVYPPSPAVAAAKFASLASASASAPTATEIETPFATATPTAITTSTAGAIGPKVVPHAGASRSLPGESLSREASLVASARAALVRGDGASALRAIDSTRALPARQLEPEELAVRAQALRALGKTQEADAADAALKTRYPLSELVRSR